MVKSLEVDQYIEQAKPFARPILKHLRKLVHEVCPEAEEAIKWNFPTFSYKGLLCHMTAFQTHCAFGFWKDDLLRDLKKSEGMGQFGKITCLEDLPSDKRIKSYIQEAMKLNEQGIKKQKKPVSEKKLVIPKEVAVLLKKNPQALKTFENFSYTKKKDYLDWLAEAKQELTRQKRLATMIGWLKEGKSRNWKYE